MVVLDVEGRLQGLLLLVGQLLELLPPGRERGSKCYSLIRQYNTGSFWTVKVQWKFGPVVELVLGLVDLVLVTVLRAQQLLVHLVHIGDSDPQVVHFWLQRLKPAARTTPL